MYVLKHLPVPAFSLMFVVLNYCSYHCSNEVMKAMHIMLCVLCIKKTEKFFALVKTLFNIVMGIAFPVLTNPST